VLDLETGSRRALVKQTRPGRNEDTAPTWSPSLGGDAFGVYSPRWSHDGRFLSFEVSHYEGSSIWFYDVPAARLFRQSGLPDYSYADPSLGELSWAPAGASTVVPHNGTTVGLVLSAVDEPSRATLVEIEGPSVAEAAVSAGARLVAFTLGQDEYGAEPRVLATVGRGEADRRVIDDAGVKSSVAFDANGRLWWIEGGTLLRWDGSSAAEIGRLEPSLRWEILSIDGDAISLVGRSAESGRASFVLFDAVKEETLTQHESDTDYTTYLGLA
jgi:hypothetical protein